MNSSPILPIGTLVHVQSDELVDWAIRHALTRWHKRYCQRVGKIFAPVWGHHDGMIVPCSDSPTGTGVAEALAVGGCQTTPIERYWEREKTGKVRLRFYLPIAADHCQLTAAACHWMMSEVGKPYDFFGIWRLWAKTIFGGMSEAVANWHWANWCTEVVDRCYMAGGLDVFQTRTPTPLTTEQVAGELSRKDGKKITLKRIA